MTGRPNVDKLLRMFFLRYNLSQKPVTVTRCNRIEIHLRHFLDICAEDYLAPEQRQLLELERQFQPYGSAFARLMHAGELLAALPEFLAPEWLMDHGVDRKVQISHSDRLVRWICGERLVDSRAHRMDLLHFRTAHDQALRVQP